MFKPADWKYQSGVSSSWSTVSCSLNVDMMVPLPDSRTATKSMDACLKVGMYTKLHTHQFSLMWSPGGTDLQSCCVTGWAEKLDAADPEWSFSD